MIFSTYDDSTANDRDQLKTTMQPPIPTMNIYHVSMLHVFFKTNVCQTIYHSTFRKRTISPWSIRLGSDSSISPWSDGCRVCPPRHGLHLRMLVARTNEVWSPNPYILHLLSVLQLTTTMVLPVRTMHYRRHQKQTAGSRLLLLCPPYCLQYANGSWLRHHEPIWPPCFCQSRGRGGLFKS